MAPTPEQPELLFDLPPSAPSPEHARAQRLVDRLASIDGKAKREAFCAAVRWLMKQFGKWTAEAAAELVKLEWHIALPHDGRTALARLHCAWHPSDAAALRCEFRGSVFDRVTIPPPSVDATSGEVA